MDIDEGIGRLVTRLRLARGMSQAQVADRLCEAAARHTITRHELSRWERGQRTPAGFWLGWLAVVLETPLEDLEAATAVTRPRRRPDDLLPGRSPRLWQPPTAAELAATLDHARVAGLGELARIWLTDHPSPVTGQNTGLSLASAVPVIGEGTGSDVISALEGRLRVLRRADDIVGGLDLAAVVDKELRDTLETLQTVGTGRLRRRALRLVAGYGQLAGWVHADAEASVASRRAYRMALHAAVAAGDEHLGGHVLGCLAHEHMAAHDWTDGLALARGAVTGVPGHGPARLRALLLHRLAAAAALAGEHREAETALAAAETAAEQIEPGEEPDWLYWLDHNELAAMTGRCLAVLHRPLRAVRLLAPHAATATVRTAALDAVALARCYVDLGEVEEACQIATQALARAGAIGSARVTTALRHLHPTLLRHRELPAVHRYQRRASALRNRPTPHQPPPMTTPE